MSSPRKSPRKSPRTSPRNSQPNAYIIAGHGRNPSETFIVPDGCIVVVKVKEGNLQYYDNIFELYKNMCSLYKSNNKIPSFPLHYSNDIIKSIGSIAIYKPGDTCPNFSYSLLPYHDFLDKNQLFDIFGGLLDYNNLCSMYTNAEHKTYNDMHVNLLNAPNINVIFNLIKSAYSLSIYPTFQKVNSIFKNITKYYDLDLYEDLDESTDLLFNDEKSEFFEYKQSTPSLNNKTLFIKFILNILRDQEIFNVNQEYLLQQFPGIHYNFVCRQNDIYNNYKNFNRKFNILNMQNSYTKNLNNFLKNENTENKRDNIEKIKKKMHRIKHTVKKQLE